MRYALPILLCLLACRLNAQDLSQLGKKQPLRLQGALSTGFQTYHVYGIDPRSANPMWNINGAATLSAYGLAVPLSFTLGRQGAQASYPAFRQFGASPQWRWIRVHAGWRNMQLSPYSLAGHSFLGLGVELNPGKFRFAAMRGRLRQAHSLPADGVATPFPPSFRRNAYALKLGVGSQRNYFDLIYFRAKDDAASLPFMADSSLTPAENAVLGYACRFRLGKHLGFFSDAALSMFTRDLNSEVVTDSSRIPEVPLLLKPRFSSRLDYAARAGLEFHFRHFNLKTVYERIAPNYESMGAYYFNNDIQNITISPNFAFARQKARFFGTLGLQRNNLAGNLQRTTERLIGNAMLSVNPSPKFGVDLHYMNASVNQQERRFVAVDSLRIAVVNSNIGLTPRWNWVDSSGTTQLYLSASRQQLNDRNPFTREFANLTTELLSLNFGKNYLRHAWGWTLGANANSIRVYQINSQRYGMSATLLKNWREGANSAAVSGAWNASRVEGKSDGSVWTGTFSLGLNLGAWGQLNLYSNLIRNTSRQFGNYTEIQGGVNLTRNFATKGKD